MQQLFPLMKGARLGLRVNTPLSKGLGRATHPKMLGPAGGRAASMTSPSGTATCPASVFLSRWPCILFEYHP